MNEPGLSISFPLKLVGDENNAANVVIEMGGTLSWYGKGGWIEGITFRRPKMSSGEGSSYEMLRVLDGGRLDAVHSVIDNKGSSSSSAVTVDGPGSKGHWFDVAVSGGREQGIKVDNAAKLELTEVCLTMLSVQ